MGNTLSIKTNYSIDDTKSIVLEALKKQADFIHYRFLKFDNECKKYEKEFKMDSDMFLSGFESGELGDDVQWFDWYAALRGRKFTFLTFFILEILHKG